MQRTALGMVLAVLLLAPAADAAASHPYEARLAFQAAGGGATGAFSLLSGSLEATLAGSGGAYGLFGVEAAHLTGLTRVCYRATCHASPSGQLAIAVAEGGSFGIRFPQPATAVAQADHALALPLDFGAGLDGLGAGKALVAPAVHGRFAFMHLPAIPTTAAQPAATGARADAGGLMALDAATRIQVLDGTQVKATLQDGRMDPIAFQGQPALGELHPALMVLPFEAGSAARMAPASPEAAAAGLDPGRIKGLLDDLSQSRLAAGGALDGALGRLAPLLPFLNGALATMPSNATGNPMQDLGLVRFERLEAARDGEAVAVAGAGPLQVKGGEVAHAPPLVGFAIFQMPWWSYVLWGVAAALFVTRLAVKPPTANPAFDRHRWVGLACSVLLFLLFFWLWDMEVREVLGVSLLHANGAAGEAFLALAALELAPMLAVLAAVVAPVRVILRNGVRLARGGRLMGLPPAFAYPLGYVFGAPLLLAYLNVGLRAAIGT